MLQVQESLKIIYKNCEIKNWYMICNLAKGFGKDQRLINGVALPEQFSSFKLVVKVAKHIGDGQVPGWVMIERWDSK